MSTSTSGSAGSTEPRSMVWLWERAPDSVELQKVRVPAAIVPPGWLVPLQRRYHHGDRVTFTWHDEARTGTIVQDQGMYVAVDGDAPDGATRSTKPTSLHSACSTNPSHLRLR